MKEKLQQIYELRFSGFEEYRLKVWHVLVHGFFCKWINHKDRVLDLGCGYGEFINNLQDCHRLAMDLNPDSKKFLDSAVEFHQQDSSLPWQIAPNSLDLVFSSNFFEHLPNKETLSQTIAQAHQALKPGGRIIALGPNIGVLKGRYWDFWDHHVGLSEQSMGELLEVHDFTIERKIGKFLPFNMVRVRRSPLFLVHLYLRLPWIWPLFGKQFMIVAQKANS